MKIETKQQLKEVIQLCRKLGVQSIRIDGIEFHLGSLPVVYKRQKKSTPSIETPTNKYPLPNEMSEEAKIINEINAVDSDQLTDEQLMYYSAVPEEHKSQ